MPAKGKLRGCLLVSIVAVFLLNLVGCNATGEMQGDEGEQRRKVGHAYVSAIKLYAYLKMNAKKIYQMKKQQMNESAAELQALVQDLERGRDDQAEQDEDVDILAGSPRAASLGLRNGLRGHKSKVRCFHCKTKDYRLVDY